MVSIDKFAIYKYFKGGKVNPFIGKNQLSAIWWDGEKSFYGKTQSDPNFISNIQTMLEDAIRNKEVSGILIDGTIDLKKRALLFYLDLWFSKWFPYCDYNLIFDC